LNKHTRQKIKKTPKKNFDKAKQSPEGLNLAPALFSGMQYDEDVNIIEE
jgi:hypothetical protein